MMKDLIPTKALPDNLTLLAEDIERRTRHLNQRLYRITDRISFNPSKSVDGDLKSEKLSARDLEGPMRGSYHNLDEAENILSTIERVLGLDQVEEVKGGASLKDLVR